MPISSYLTHVFITRKPWFSVISILYDNCSLIITIPLRVLFGPVTDDFSKFFWLNLVMPNLLASLVWPVSKKSDTFRNKYCFHTTRASLSRQILLCISKCQKYICCNRNPAQKDEVCKLNWIKSHFLWFYQWSSEICPSFCCIWRTRSFSVLQEN